MVTASSLSLILRPLRSQLHLYRRQFHDRTRLLCTAASKPTPPPPPPPETRTPPLRRLLYIAGGISAAAVSAHYMFDPAPYHILYQNIYSTIDSNIRYFSEPSREKLLPDPPSLPQPPLRTLVLDLDETLIYSSYSRATGWRIAKRPGLEAFLAYLAQFFEIVVFTNALNSYADPILQKLDPKNYNIAHRLFRAETHYKNGVHVKNLDPLNRDLARVIVIDHKPECVSMHPENAIIVPKWTGDPTDTALIDLIPFLESVVQEDVYDVREVLQAFQGRSVNDGVQEYTRMKKSMKKEERGVNLFGTSHAQPQQQEQQNGDGKDEEKSGAVWGGLGGGGLFTSRRQST